MAARNVQRSARNTSYRAVDRYGNPIQRGNVAYQHGTTVRKVREKERERRGYDYYQERRYREEYEIKERNRRRLRKQFLINKKTNALTLPNFIVISIGSVAVVAMCIFYLSLLSSISSQSTQLNELQSQLVAVQEENSARYNHLNNSVSLEEVRDRAVNSLGMINATEDQIVTYQEPTNDYMTQNEAIPR